MINHLNAPTGELLDLTDAIRRVPRYAFRLIGSVKSLAGCLDKIASGPRWLRWLPFRIVPTRCLNELMIRADQVENDATTLGVVGYFIASNDATIPNPWKVLDDKS